MHGNGIRTTVAAQTSDAHRGTTCGFPPPSLRSCPFSLLNRERLTYRHSRILRRAVLPGTLVMGYVRLWRHKQIIPGIRLNVSKSGPSLSFGPRGMHYTVGRRGRRMTAGIPGTGVYYTSYSRSHARHAGRTYANAAHATAAPAAMRASHSEPMLPKGKIILGICLVWLPPVGLIIVLVGLSQRNKPFWVARDLVARARKNPQQAEQLLEKAAAVLRAGFDRR
jgi:Protein of unknown function (DUF4236)